MSGVVAKRMLRVETNFEEILEDYLSTRLPVVGEPPDDAESLKRFCDSLHKFTQFQSFQELATLTYGDPASNCCIVSSIEFDRDGEFFAVAGVTKKIKIFEYESVVRNTGFTNHFPVHEMSCAAKLSCIAYNPYHKHHLVSSDYEGSVCVWDTNIGRRTALHQEHGRRVWSVAYNPQEPTLFASGSDDCTVKLWSMGQPNSIFSFSARANICSVKFNPHSRYMLAYGSADHGVHYVDLRSPNQPLLELLGHKKAVSYVDFMGPNELVSASTDSELKSWHTERGVCLRTFRGHLNDKNFVGLTVNPDFIACGSENNAVYVYSKQISSPMLTYQYNCTRGLLPSSAVGETGQSPEPSEFVSAVTWRNSSNVLLAANSQGHIKVLEMC
jgi:E3 ubiquitin-protein ligase RFWD2